MAYTCFSVEVADKVAHVRMIRPERANSMIPEFWSELPTIVDDLSDRGTVRAMVLSAVGRHFCSGMDLSVFAASDELGGAARADPAASSERPSRARRAEAFRAMALHLQRSFSCLEQARFPVIAAVNGACVGGGVDMVSACDFRYASTDAYFCIQEINIGMTADVGTLQRLPKLVAPGIVAELAYTGRRMPAARAAQVGLVNEVFDDADATVEAALAAAVEIAAKSPLAISGTKRNLQYSMEHSIADGLEYIATWNASMLDARDMAEAFLAGQEKRPPNFADLEPRRRGL
ncbi:MAG: crotonase/enoyl-CoA hydratase family protein [Acidimicrobiia bacterium]|nr:crotonase/enoyl-CoA hydratase family protein [Acidimicrobiia bacterium]